MKKKIKKNRLKIFIALSLMFTLITTIFIGTKTFAYETDTFSYTINNISTTNQNINITNSNNTTIINGYNTNANFMLEMNDITYYDNSNYLMINYVIEKSTDNVNWGIYQIQPSQTSSSSVQMISNFIKNNLTVGNGRVTYIQNLARFYVMSKNYYSNVIPLYNLNQNNFDYDSINIILNTNVVGTSYWRITIYNIDVVGTSEIGLPQYYETYYSQIEENYNQLLEEYEQLEDDYSQLNNDYTELEENYNDLEENYNDLENNYNELSSNNQNGIWSEIKSQVCFADNYGYFGYTLEELLQNNFVNALDNNIIMDAYTRKPDATSFHTTLNFYRNDEVSNATTFVPLTLLNFRVSSNVNYNSVSTFIRIEAMNLDNLEDGNIPTYRINITPQILQLFDYEITFDKIANYFNDINFNYYNALGFIHVYWNKRAANDYIRFTSLNDLFSTGYISGYQQGAAAYVEQNKILEQQIKDLNNEITSLNLVINSLNEQIRTFNTDYNLNNLMWTIGSTPFESFKHIWNVNFLGVNLADFVLGFITTFIGIWILKKFFI